MNILSISTDRTICDSQSAAHARQKVYARELGEMTVVVCTYRGAHESREGTLHIIPTNSSSRLLYGWDAWWTMRRLGKPDVVTVQDPFETGLLGLMRAALWGVPLHVQIHTDFIGASFARHSFANSLRRIIARSIISRAARIRVITEKMAHALHTWGITVPITVLPIFVDVARYAHLTRIKHPRFMAAFVYIGRLESEKRPELAIESIAAARKAGHDAGLTIVGDGTLRPVLEARVRSLGLERYVDFVGRHEDIGPYLAQADAVIVPSQYEGYGLVIVEALAAGIPVIATDVGIAREAGAIVTTASALPTTVVEWISKGPRAASLANYPYRDFDDYVRRYADDIRASTPRSV